MAKPNTKFDVVTYEKEFETFADMVNEMKSIHPEMNNIFIYEDEEISANTVMDDAISYFAKNAPDVISRQNLAASLNVASNRVTLKTNKFFTIRWKYKYDENGFVTDIVASISTFSKNGKVNKDMAAMIEALTDENSGWKIVEQ